MTESLDGPVTVTGSSVRGAETCVRFAKWLEERRQHQQLAIHAEQALDGHDVLELLVQAPEGTPRDVALLQASADLCTLRLQLDQHIQLIRQAIRHELGYSSMTHIKP